MKISTRITIALLGLALLTACAPQAAAMPTLEPIPTSTTPVPAPTLTSSPTPLVEPLLPDRSYETELAVTPPDFNKQPENDVPFDFVAAHAVYAYFRQQEGHKVWADQAQFVADMAAYYDSLKSNSIRLIQVAEADITYSLLVKGNQILLDFNQNGSLRSADPGEWSADSAPEWVDVGAPVELFIGADNHAYIARLNSDGQVDAFFNPIGATLDNLDQHWVAVADGYPNAAWDGKEWDTSMPKPLGVAGWTRTEDSLFLSPEEMVSLPTPLTWADLHRTDLGPMFQTPPNEDGEFWLTIFGKVVSTQYVEMVKGGRTVSAMTILYDVPAPNHQGYIRISTILDSESFELGSVLPGEPFQKAFDLYNQSGADPQAEDARNQAIQLAIAQGSSLQDFSYYTLHPKEAIDQIAADADAFGREIGVKIYSQAAAIRSADYQPNPLVDFLLGKITQDQLDQQLRTLPAFQSGQFYLPPEWLTK